MHNNKLVQALKATISSIIVAFFITSALMLVIYLFCGQEIEEIFSLVSKVSIDINPERERGLTNEITLFQTNKKGGNDLQLEKVINHYPQILDILKETE